MLVAITGTPGTGKSSACDVLAESVEHRLDRPFRQLQHHVPGEAVADDDIGGAEQEVTALRVAAEVEPLCRGQQRH